MLVRSGWRWTGPRRCGPSTRFGDGRRLLVALNGFSDFLRDSNAFTPKTPLLSVFRYNVQRFQIGSLHPEPHAQNPSPLTHAR